MQPTAGEYDEAIRELDKLLEALAKVVRWQVEVDDNHRVVDQVDGVKQLLANVEPYRDIIPEHELTEWMARSERLNTLLDTWRNVSGAEATPTGSAENAIEHERADGEQRRADYHGDIDQLSRSAAYMAGPACSKMLMVWHKRAQVRRAVDSLQQLDLPPETRDRFREALTCELFEPGPGPRSRLVPYGNAWVDEGGHPPEVRARVRDQFEALRAACNEARDLWSLAEDEPAEEPPRLLGNITRILDDLARRAERASSIANTIPLPPNPPPPMVPGPVPKPEPKPE